MTIFSVERDCSCYMRDSGYNCWYAPSTCNQLDVLPGVCDIVQPISLSVPLYPFLPSTLLVLV